MKSIWSLVDQVGCCSDVYTGAASSDRGNVGRGGREAREGRWLASLEPSSSAGREALPLVAPGGAVVDGAVGEEVHGVAAAELLLLLLLLSAAAAVVGARKNVLEEACAAATASCGCSVALGGGAAVDSPGTVVVVALELVDGGRRHRGAERRELVSGAHGLPPADAPCLRLLRMEGGARLRPPHEPEGRLLERHELP